MKNNFEAKKKIVERGRSEVYKCWSEMGNISEDDFIRELKWLCDDPFDKDNNPTRELGYKVDVEIVDDDSVPVGFHIAYDNGRFYHLKRVTDNIGISFYYDDIRAGKRNHTLWHTGNCNHYSISARDAI